VLKTDVINLNEVVSDFQKMISRIIGEDIETRIFLSSGLNLVKADKGQINQVLFNLVINARDAMPKGGKLTIETKNITLSTEQIEILGDELREGAFVLLAISDTGIGMDKFVQEHLFEPFFTTKSHGKGTGLGLSTVYGIVKQHGGNISCYSEKDKGTTFKIYLPAAELLKVPEKHIEEPAEYNLNGTETIFVIEDDEMVRKLVCSTLNTYRYNVLESGDPLQAIDIAKTHKGPIAMILSDVVMPQMNGQELYNELLKVHPKMKVLYISGYAEKGIISHGFLQDGVNFLQKPFSLKNLAKKVRQTLES